MAPQAGNTAARFLERVVAHYLSSRGYNGLRVDHEDRPWSRAASTLRRKGLIEVISERDYPNPHIRPWPCRRSPEKQLDDIRGAMSGTGPAVCLYPTAAALVSRPEVAALKDEPFRQRLASGSGGLDLAFFRLDVLEPYRNDPTFHFEFSDFGAQTAISDDAYLKKETPEHEKVLLHHLGFAYKQPVCREGPIYRGVAGFVRDLANLSPVHQQRWATYEITDGDWQPHPMWWRQMMGDWGDGRGPFEALLYELTTWNELHERAFGTPLLRSTERPREFGWVLRSSQKEYDDFVQQLDKLLSENLCHEAFDAARVPRKDGAGTTFGTLNRLDLLLEAMSLPKDDRSEVLKPLREVRSARSKPAHAIRQNINDASIAHRQAELIGAVTGSVRDLRLFWQKHPANSDWKEPEHSAGLKVYWL